MTDPTETLDPSFPAEERRLLSMLRPLLPADAFREVLRSVEQGEPEWGFGYALAEAEHLGTASDELRGAIASFRGGAPTDALTIEAVATGLRDALPTPANAKAKQLAEFGSHALIAGEPWEAVLSFLDAFDVQGAKPPTELLDAALTLNEANAPDGEDAAEMAELIDRLR